MRERSSTCFIIASENDYMFKYKCNCECAFCRINRTAVIHFGHDTMQTLVHCSQYNTHDIYLDANNVNTRTRTTNVCVFSKKESFSYSNITLYHLVMSMHGGNDMPFH